MSLSVLTKGIFSYLYPVWIICCCSASKSCPTLCNSMDCSTPDSPVLHYLLEFAQIHVHWVGDANRLILWCFHLLLPSFFPNIKVFFQLFASSSQSIGASALASVLPVNIQDWFPLGLTDLISLPSKGLSRASSCTAIWKH